MTSRTQAPRRRLSAADRREAILAAALEVFSERGFHDASLDDVAARNGVSKALIYEHFASKRDLYAALLDTQGHELFRRVASVTADAGGGEEILRAGAAAFLAYVEEHRGGWRTLSRAISDQEIAESLVGLQREGAGIITSLLEAALPPSRAGDPNVGPDLEMLAWQILGASQTLADWWSLHPEIPREQVLQAWMDFAWVGLGRLSEGQRWRSADAPD